MQELGLLPKCGHNSTKNLIKKQKFINMAEDKLKQEAPHFGNTLLGVVKWVYRQFGHVWCLFVHGLIRDKHKMHKAYDPMECQICGRWWEL